MAHIWFVTLRNKPNTVENSQPLSEKDAYALGVINVLVYRNPDLSPSLSEIARFMDVKKQEVGRVLLVLERKGYLTRTPKVHRSIRLTKKQLPFATQKRAA